MSRPLRLEFNGALYHVTSRGDRREDIFLDDTDGRAWLAVLAQVCERLNWVAYVHQAVLRVKSASRRHETLSACYEMHSE